MKLIILSFIEIQLKLFHHFFTFHHMIINIFGWSFKKVNFYCEQLIKKNNDFKNYNLLFDIYNLKKFKIFLKQK